MKNFLLVLVASLLCQNFANAQWAPVGAGVNSSSDALAIYNNQLVSGGRYSSLAKWDGTNWSDFTVTGSPSATSILVEGADLYAGGQFTGGDAAKQIMHYDGNSWSIVGGDVSAYTNVSWNTNNRWWNLFKYNSNFYGIYDGGLMKFDGTTFNATGDQTADLGGPIGGIRYVGTMNSTAYFTGMVNGVFGAVYTWNDNNWDSLDIPGYIMHSVSAAQVVNNELFLSGGFSTPTDTFLMIKYNGTSFTDYLPWVMPIVTVWNLYEAGNHLYANYYYNGVQKVGIWNGSSFTSLGGGAAATGGFNAIEELNNVAYAGGFFTTFDGVTANNIAQYALSTGVNDLVVNDISIYPNPVQTIISFEPASSVRSLNIYNVLGQSCMKINLDADVNHVSVNSLTNGSYMLQIIDGNDVRSTRFIKQ